ncbi:MAG: polysaccharide deacetylase family protein [Candidatus Latescibacteria bacterium]|jgi:peptidoglycan/xylan/chitin deacetylase (PgdA/CDA1 family)|nr:polysaccharide deacetylase family protein [Candidatus Latescibacterota bacterium]
MAGPDRADVTICKWRNDAPFAYSMTYDEGTVDALANGLPIHERFGIPGHVDVVAGQLGRQRNAFASSINEFFHMSVDELKFMLDKGWGVGNHSWSHYLYPCMPGLDLFREVVWSRYRLEDMLDSPVRIFTIPNSEINYEPVLDLVKQHYLACAYISGGPNRDGFDLYRIGNCMVAAGGFRPREGWPEEMKTENLSAEFIADSWVYETSHLFMWDVPQSHKCVTPEYMIARFGKLNEVSDGRFWAAKPDDVIDYELLRRNLRVENVRTEETVVRFDVAGEWPVGIINSDLTLRLSGSGFDRPPEIEQEFHSRDGGQAMHNAVQTVARDGDDWLITMQLTPGRTVSLRPS